MFWFKVKTRTKLGYEGSISPLMFKLKVASSWRNPKMMFLKTSIDSPIKITLPVFCLLVFDCSFVPVLDYSNFDWYFFQILNIIIIFISFCHVYNLLILKSFYVSCTVPSCSIIPLLVLTYAVLIKCPRNDVHLLTAFLIINLI